MVYLFSYVSLYPQLYFRYNSRVDINICSQLRSVYFLSQLSGGVKNLSSKESGEEVALVFLKMASFGLVTRLIFSLFYSYSTELDRQYKI